jgi:hypothetical protein
MGRGVQGLLAEELPTKYNGGDIGMIFKQMSDTKEVERPWQGDIDRLQHTLQDVLAAISNLTGVELTGDTSDLEAANGSHAPLEYKNLKDRIRKDLETFAASTASELAQQAERQTRVALAAIHSEADGQVEQVARELREKLQGQIEPGHFEIGITQQTQDRVAELVQRRTDEFARWVWLMCKGTGTPIPVQIEKLLEPYVEEATGRLSESFRKQFDHQIAEQQQIAQSRLQETLSSLKEQITSLDQTAKKICEENADSVARMSVDRLNSVADETAKSFASRFGEQLQNDYGILRTRLESAAEEMRERLRKEVELKAGDYSSKVAAIEADIEEKAAARVSSHIEQTAANVIESSIQHLHEQTKDTLEHSKEELKGFLELQMEEARLKISSLGESVQTSLSQDAERRAESLKKLDQEISGIREKNVADSKDQLSTIVQGALESMKDRIGQISSAQLQEINRLVQESRAKEASQYESQLRGITDSWYNNLLERIQAEAGKAAEKVAGEVRANSDSVLQELSDKVDASALILREETTKATTQIESMLKGSLDTYQTQLAEITGNRLEEHRQVIRKTLTDLQARLERSAQILRQEIAGTIGPDL